MVQIIFLLDCGSFWGLIRLPFFFIHFTPHYHSETMIDYAVLKDLPRLTSSRTLVHFQDCDPFQHLNNIKYFDYFFNAREDQVTHQYKFNATEVFRKMKAGWVIYHHEISYIRPAGVGEWVRIFSRIIFYNDNTLVIEYFMTDDSGRQLKTLLWSTLKYVDLQGKLSVHPAAITAYLKAVASPIENFEKTDFLGRIKVLKAKIAEKNTCLIEER